MATMAELTMELAKINASIDRITGTATGSGAQSYGISGRSLQRADLNVLYKRKDRLELAISRLNSGGIATHPLFGRPGGD